MSHHDTAYQSHDAIYQAYASGHLAPDVALQGLARHYGDVDGLIADLEKGREVIRNMIEEVVDRLPDRKASAAGYDIAIVASGDKSVSWDKALDALAKALVATGDAEMVRVANRIGMARKTSRRGESLRITKRKGEQDAE